MPELSKDFIRDIKDYDQNLDAWYDSNQDGIHIFAIRQGKKILELTVLRQEGELYPELERRAVIYMKERDVWKRFGSGKAYDDYLAAEEERVRLQRKQEAKSKRIQLIKEHRWEWMAALWNAAHGRFDRKSALPFKIPTNTPAKSGRVVQT